MRGKQLILGSASVLAVLGAASCGPTMPNKARIQELRHLYKLQKEYVQEFNSNNASNRIVQFSAGDEPGFILAGTVANAAEDLPSWEDLPGSGLWMTHDNGVTWTAATNGLDATKCVEAIVCDDARNLLYVASLRGGIARSQDRGVTWEHFSDGLPAGIIVCGLTLDPQSGTLAATLAQDGIGAYLRERDADGWRAIGDGIPAEAAVVKELLPTEEGVIALTGTGPVIIITGYKPYEFGIFLGTPDGADYQWARMRHPYRSKSFEAVSVIQLSATGSLLAGGAAGVWEQTGKGWTCILDEDFVSDIVVEQGRRQRILVRTADKLLVQEAGVWKPLEGTPWNPLAFVLQMQFAHGTVYVLTSDGLFFTRENGVWVKVPAPGSAFPHVVQRGL